jgi:diguanylate cyclase (GGDEF)-like protein
LRTADSTAATSDETTGIVLTPALEAEAERLLAGRTRDIRFSPEMLRAYREKNWQQRSKIIRAWTIWVAAIATVFVPVSYLIIPASLQQVAVTSGFMVPALNMCAYIVWRKPRSPIVEGLSLVLLMFSVTIVYGCLALTTGGNDYERLLTCVAFVNAIAIFVFNISYRWSLILMTSAVGNFFAFEILNPAINFAAAIGTTMFYAMGFFAVTAARRTQSILAQKTYLMSLRDQHRSARLKDANRQLEVLARCDSLTGLANRRSAENLIETLWSDRRMARTTIAFVMADIDWFKLLNDTAGHAAGDECIKHVGRLIETAVRPDHDTVCRYGGEEFLIVLTDTTPDLAWALAERIRCTVEGLGIVNPGIRHADGSSGVVTISLGVAFAQEGVPPELVTKWADDALYDAKRSGRNVVFMSTAPRTEPPPAEPQREGVEGPVNDARMTA